MKTTVAFRDLPNGVQKTYLKFRDKQLVRTIPMIINRNYYDNFLMNKVKAVPLAIACWCRFTQTPTTDGIFGE